MKRSLLHHLLFVSSSKIYDTNDVGRKTLFLPLNVEAVDDEGTESIILHKLHREIAKLRPKSNCKSSFNDDGQNEYSGIDLYGTSIAKESTRYQLSSQSSTTPSPSFLPLSSICTIFLIVIMTIFSPSPLLLSRQALASTIASSSSPSTSVPSIASSQLLSQQQQQGFQQSLPQFKAMKELQNLQDLQDSRLSACEGMFV